MKPERWRLFVAVPIGDELRRDLASAVDEWRKRPDLAGLRWTEPETWHVTVAFLGSVDVSAVAQVRARLEAVALRHPPMLLATGGLGAFPSGARARVAWYGVADPDGAFRKLAVDVRRTLDQDDDQFLPHVTIARAARGRVALQTWLSEAVPPSGQLRADRLVLMRSHHGGVSARYEPLTTAFISTGIGV